MQQAEFAKTIKRVDPDRYRAALLAEKTMRDQLLCLYGFHYELAKIPELVSEPMLGAIRYQWWRDCVDEIYTDKPVRRHEVATPLADMLRGGDVPRFWIDRLIDGRAHDIDPRPFEDMDAARQYCANTSGQLMQIAVKLIGGKDVDEGGGDNDVLLGQAWGLTGLARSYRFYHDTMLKHLDFKDICAAAREDYTMAREAMPKILASAMPALGYGTLIPSFLQRMEKVSFHPKETALVLGPFAKQSRLLITALTGKLPRL